MALGRQLTLEFYDCAPAVLADAGQMEAIFLASARKSGATIISSHFHAFEPQGVSGVVIISESHFAVHAWPEFDYAAVDIFTCGDSIDFEKAAEVIQHGLGSTQMVVSSVMSRGIVNNLGIERLVPLCEDRYNRYSFSWRDRFEKTDAAGISTVIDLYGCPLKDLVLSSVVGELLNRLEATVLGSSRCDELYRHVTANGWEVFRQEFADGSAEIRIDPVSGKVYLTFSAMHFFEPRLAAESALACFRGERYRMQIAIRQ